jgi:predicted ribosome quality control (RQC) complex YloA/Tae2 family protein
MTKIEIDTRKTIYENAAVYYDKAKKIKAKMEGLKKAIEETKKLIAEEEKKIPQVPEKKIERKKEWYEKFHWAFIGEKVLIGGKDAKSNEIVVKKYMEPNDLYFHADIHGASSMVLKDGQAAGGEEKKQAAQFAACFSSAWKSGTEACDVFCVKPEQVKTAAPSGAYLPKGAFVIEGKKEIYRKVPLQLGLTIKDNKIIFVPSHTAQVIIKPNPQETKGESAKKILFFLKKKFPKAEITIDDVLRVLPNGGSKVV